MAKTVNSERGKTMSKIPNVHVKARKSNCKMVYDYYFYGPDIQGKRNQIYKGGFNSEKEAFEAGIKARDEMFIDGISVRRESGDISVSDFAYNVWFPAKCSMKKWQDTTKESYRKKIKNLVVPYIGNYPVRMINVEILQHVLDTMYDDEGYSHNTVSNLHGMFCNMFKYAKEHGYIENFYSDDLQVPKLDEDEDDAELHRHQYRGPIPKDVLDKIFERFPEGSSSYLPMIISLYTGARLGEAFGLTWEEIDFDNNTIRIRRQMIDYPKMYLSNPKYNSKREVPICPTLKTILLKEKEKQERNKAFFGDRYIHTYVTKRPNTEDFKNKHGIYDIYFDYGETEVSFVNVYEDGTPITPSVMKHTSRIIHGYSSYLKSPNKKKKNNPIFDDYNTHSLRHTFATSLNAQGLDPMVLSTILGHKMQPKIGMASITTTYIHLNNADIQKAVPFIESVYSFKTSE